MRVSRHSASLTLVADTETPPPYRTDRRVELALGDRGAATEPVEQHRQRELRDGDRRRRSLLERITHHAPRCSLDPRHHRSPTIITGRPTATRRRNGSPRRPAAKTIAGAYDVAGLADIASVRRVLEIAVLDALGLDDSLARSRVLIDAAGAAARLLEAEREEGWGWEQMSSAQASSTPGHASQDLVPMDHEPPQPSGAGVEVLGSLGAVATRA